MAKKIFMTMVVICSIATLTSCYCDNPYARFEIYGTVVNEQDEPIKDITIDLYRDNIKADDYTHTDRKGRYNLNTIDMAGSTDHLDTIYVVATDQKGRYQKISRKIPIEYIDDNDSHHSNSFLYQGKAIVEASFVMKKE